MLAIVMGPSCMDASASALDVLHDERLHDSISCELAVIHLERAGSPLPCECSEHACALLQVCSLEL